MDRSDIVECRARGLENHLGAKRFLAMNLASEIGKTPSWGFFDHKNRLFNEIKCPDRSADKSIFAGTSKKDIGEIIKELARPGPIIEIKDPMYEYAVQAMQRVNERDRPFRDLLLLC